MNAGIEKEDAIRAWLRTEEARSVLNSVAKYVLQVAREKRYSFDFIGLGGTTLTDEVLREDIESEIVHFILENIRGIQGRLMLAGHKAGLVLRSDFLRHWLDATRSPKSDPWRYLYKRTVDTLRDSALVKIKTGPSGSSRGTFFSMTTDSIDIQEPSEEDICAIVPPRSLLPTLTFEALSKADVLADLAAHFWQELSERHGPKPIWVSVRAFVNWIASNVPIEKARRKEAAGAEPDPLECIPEEQAGQEDLFFDREEIRRWARNFSNSLTKKEGLAFALHLGQGLTLDQVADKMGYGGPSGPEYHINKAKKKLKRFLCDLPWLSPPDLNEEAFACFEDELLLALKRQEP